MAAPDTAIQEQVKHQIFDLWVNDNSGFNSAINGMFPGKYPSGITQDDFPLVTLNIITSDVGYTFDDSQVPHFEEIIIHFLLLSSTLDTDEITDVLDKLEALYDGASLDLTGWGLLEMTRIPGNAVVGPFLDEDEVWNITIKYSVSCEKD